MELAIRVALNDKIIEKPKQDSKKYKPESSITSAKGGEKTVAMLQAIKKYII